MCFPVGRYTPDTDYRRVLEGCRYLDYMGKTEVRLVVPGLPTEAVCASAWTERHVRSARWVRWNAQ